jgi:hypothetical protein
MLLQGLQVAGTGVNCASMEINFIYVMIVIVIF